MLVGSELLSGGFLRFNQEQYRNINETLYVWLMRASTTSAGNPALEQPVIQGLHGITLAI